MGSEVVPVVEAAYRLELDDQTWVHGLVGAAAPAFGPGAGVAAVLVGKAAPHEGLALRAAASDGLASELCATVTRRKDTLFVPEVRESFRSSGYVVEISRGFGERFRAPGGLAEILATHGMEDGVFVVASDGSGIHCVLSVTWGERGRWSRRRRVAWACAAAHMAGAVRLRNATNATGLEAPVAVIDTRFRVVHAEGEARERASREALREAALQSDRARAKRSHGGAEDPITLWRALVAGRWSLVDHFDRDGRRFLVARRNPPVAPEHLALTRREREVAALAVRGLSLKLVAYSMGLAVSTVSTHLASAMRKLGVRTRVELARVFVPLPGDLR